MRPTLPRLAALVFVIPALFPICPAAQTSPPPASTHGVATIQPTFGGPGPVSVSAVLDPPQTGNDFVFPSVAATTVPPAAQTVPTLTAGQAYTLSWTALLGGRVQLAVRDGAGYATLFAAPALATDVAQPQMPGTCQGFYTPPGIALAGTCALISNVTANSGAFVWDVPDLLEAKAAGGEKGYEAALKAGKVRPFWLQLDALGAAEGDVSLSPPWQVSGEFWIVGKAWDGTALGGGMSGGGSGTTGGGGTGTTGTTTAPPGATGGAATTTTSPAPAPGTNLGSSRGMPVVEMVVGLVVLILVGGLL